MRRLVAGLSVAAVMADRSDRRNKFVCNGKMRTGMFAIDTVEKGSKGTLKPGTAWVQFCVTKGHTEADSVLILSKSGWVKVVQG